MSDVFISYRRDDRPKVEVLAKALESLGVSVFFDARIPSGSVFDEVVAAELKAAKAVIVCWTPGAVESRWVRSEASIGLERDVLLAAFFETVSLTPPFNLVQAEDLRAWRGDLSDRNFQKILDRLGVLTDRPSLADEARAAAKETEWRDRDAQAKADFDAKLSEARSLFAAKQASRPLEFEARIAETEASFLRWLTARRLKSAGAMPDPLASVSENVEELRDELATAIRERDAAVAAASRALASGVAAGRVVSETRPDSRIEPRPRAAGRRSLAPYVVVAVGAAALTWVVVQMNWASRGLREADVVAEEAPAEASPEATTTETDMVTPEEPAAVAVEGDAAPG